MRKAKNLALVCTMLLASTFLLGNQDVFKAEKSQNDTIREGVYIGGISVGGMTEQEATTAIEDYLQTLNETVLTLQGPNGTMDISFEEMGYSVNTDSKVKEALLVGNSGNLISRFKALKDLEEESYVIDMGLSIDKQKTAQMIYKKTDKLDIKAVDNSLKRENGQFVYVEGHIGDETDIVASVNALSEHVETKWENPKETPSTEFALISVETQPRGTEEELATVKDLLGGYSTSFSSSGANRVKNVTTGCEKINGTVLYPGDELSVYKLVSPFTKANGYELAGSYSNGQTVESFGGGICQVSTTLYNAALNAELEITERFNHSMTVSYVPLAADAAIAGTYKDLKFKNNYDTPVYVEGYCQGRTLTFNIYGKETRPENRTVTYVSETISTNSPVEYRISSSAPLGSYAVTSSGRTGYVAKWWKVVKVDGVETERTQVNKSTYRATTKVVTVGTAGATDEQRAAVSAAVATKNDAHIRSVVGSLQVVPEEPEQPTTPEGTQTPDAGATTPSEGTQTPSTSETTPSEGTQTPSTGETTPSEGEQNTP